MKKIILQAAEFMQFKEVANKFQILFDFTVKNGCVTVTAKITDLEFIGY